jgi:very-short-patch-repair endonuclease
LPSERNGTSPFAGEAGRGGDKPRSLAQKLRATPTASEIRLWRIIYGLRADGFHFRKQVKIGSHVVDFACIHAALVIEVDGITHDNDLAQSNDATRDDYLQGRGFTVLRFSSRDVMEEPDGVFTTIAEALKSRPRNHRGVSPPLPASPARGEVPSGSLGTIAPNSPAGALLAGRAGEGRATRSNSTRGTD